MSYLAISGRKIYYEEYGTDKAPTLIYLHGGPGESCLTYTYQARKLGETFHVISFDQYGVFRSDAVGDESLGVNDLVQMTEQMRIALGIESWIPLGHSFGGMLALVYAHTYPESIQADENINADVKAQWPVDTSNRFYNSQMKYCELFKSNKLYKEK